MLSILSCVVVDEIFKKTPLVGPCVVVEALCCRFDLVLSFVFFVNIYKDKTLAKFQLCLLIPL